MPLVYALVTSLATLLGGFLPQTQLLRRLNFKYLVGFAAGAMISIAFFDLLPEIDPANFSWIAVGFFAVYLVEKTIMLHACQEEECEHHSLSWPSLFGIAAESLADGLAIAIGYTVNPALGLSLALAVIAHELPRGFTTTIIMTNAKQTHRAARLALLIDAGFTPIGALIGLALPQIHFNPLLAVTAGIFLYVGASDLLPEVHQRFTAKVVWSVLSGVFTIFTLSRLIHL